MFKFLLVVHALVAVAMVGVILMQRSEGGGLAGGGNPAGLMSARGAADFLTRTTAILATAFVLLSIGLAAFATINSAPKELDTSLSKKPATGAVPGMPAPAPSAVPIAGGAADKAAPVETPAAAAPADVPLAAPAPKTETRKPEVREAPRQEAPKAAAPKIERPAPKPVADAPKVATPAAATPAPAPTPAPAVPAPAPTPQ